MRHPVGDLEATLSGAGSHEEIRGARDICHEIRGAPFTNKKLPKYLKHLKKYLIITCRGSKGFIELQIDLKL